MPDYYIEAGTIKCEECEEFLDVPQSMDDAPVIFECHGDGTGPLHQHVFHKRCVKGHYLETMKAEDAQRAGRAGLN